jgi:hypothetical protein
MTIITNHSVFDLENIDRLIAGVIVDTRNALGYDKQKSDNKTVAILQ